MVTLNSEALKIEQAKSYVEMKQYEGLVSDDFLNGKVSECLMISVMNECDFMLEDLIARGHSRSDLLRVAGL